MNGVALNSWKLSAEYTAHCARAPKDCDELSATVSRALASGLLVQGALLGGTELVSLVKRAWAGGPRLPQALARTPAAPCVATLLAGSMSLLTAQHAEQTMATMLEEFGALLANIWADVFASFFASFSTLLNWWLVADWAVLLCATPRVLRRVCQRPSFAPSAPLLTWWFVADWTLANDRPLRRPSPPPPPPPPPPPLSPPGRRPAAAPACSYGCVQYLRGVRRAREPAAVRAARSARDRIGQRTEVKRQAVDAEDVCAICLDELATAAVRREVDHCKFGCGKSCHRRCLRQWLRHSGRCPNCCTTWQRSHE